MSALARVAVWLRRVVTRFVLLVGVPAVAVVIGIYAYAESGRYVGTENAYVKANVIAVSANVSGRVDWVGVDDNSVVREGQTLFRINVEPFRVALEKAEAELALVRTQVEHLRTDYREARLQGDESRERVRFLTRQFERQKQMRSRNLGSEEAYDQAEHALALAKQEGRLLEERIRRTVLSLENDASIPVERHARYQQAKAARDQAALALSYTTITAPHAGIVSNMRLQVGEYVEEGEAVFGLIESGSTWVEANLKETQLTNVLEGQRATIVIDAYPDREWHAHVDAIAPATGAEFAVLPPQNATGNWVKVVQRVPVVLALGPDPSAPPLRAGMTATVTIDTERERKLSPELNALLGGRDWLADVRRIGRETITRAGLQRVMASTTHAENSDEF